MDLRDELAAAAAQVRMSTFNQRVVCESKVGYWTESRCRAAADERQFKIGVPLHVYQCPVCSRWHMTKQPQL